MGKMWDLYKIFFIYFVILRPVLTESQQDTIKIPAKNANGHMEIDSLALIRTPDNNLDKTDFENKQAINQQTTAEGEMMKKAAALSGDIKDLTTNGSQTLNAATSGSTTNEKVINVTPIVNDQRIYIDDNFEKHFEEINSTDEFDAMFGHVDATQTDGFINDITTTSLPPIETEKIENDEDIFKTFHFITLSPPFGHRTTIQHAITTTENNDYVTNATEIPESNTEKQFVVFEELTDEDLKELEETEEVEVDTEPQVETITKPSAEHNPKEQETTSAQLEKSTERNREEPGTTSSYLDKETKPLTEHNSEQGTTPLPMQTDTETPGEHTSEEQRTTPAQVAKVVEPFTESNLEEQGSTLLKLEKATEHFTEHNSEQGTTPLLMQTDTETHIEHTSEEQGTTPAQVARGTEPYVENNPEEETTPAHIKKEAEPPVDPNLDLENFPSVSEPQEALDSKEQDIVSLKALDSDHSTERNRAPFLELLEHLGLDPFIAGRRTLLPKIEKETEPSAKSNLEELETISSATEPQLKEVSKPFAESHIEEAGTLSPTIEVYIPEGIPKQKEMVKLSKTEKSKMEIKKHKEQIKTKETRKSGLDVLEAHSVHHNIEKQKASHSSVFEAISSSSTSRSMSSDEFDKLLYNEEQDDKEDQKRNPPPNEPSLNERLSDTAERFEEMYGDYESFESYNEDVLKEATISKEELLEQTNENDKIELTTIDYNEMYAKNEEISTTTITTLPTDRFVGDNKGIEMTTMDPAIEQDINIIAEVEEIEKEIKHRKRIEMDALTTPSNELLFTTDKPMNTKRPAADAAYIEEEIRLILAAEDFAKMVKDKMHKELLDNPQPPKIDIIHEVIPWLEEDSRSTTPFVEMTTEQNATIVEEKQNVGNPINEATEVVIISNGLVERITDGEGLPSATKVPDTESEIRTEVSVVETRVEKTVSRKNGKAFDFNKVEKENDKDDYDAEESNIILVKTLLNDLEDPKNQAKARIVETVNSMKSTTISTTAPTESEILTERIIPYPRRHPSIFPSSPNNDIIAVFKEDKILSDPKEHSRTTENLNWKHFPEFNEFPELDEEIKTSSELLFADEVPNILGKLLGRNVQFSVKVFESDSSFYLPEDCHIFSNENMLNITWKSMDPTLNNSLEIMLTNNRTKISSLQLTLVKDNEMFIYYKTLDDNPELYKSLDDKKIITLDDEVTVEFSNLLFLESVDYEAVERKTILATLLMEICFGVIGAVVVLGAGLYYIYKSDRERMDVAKAHSIMA